MHVVKLSGLTILVKHKVFSISETTERNGHDLTKNIMIICVCGLYNISYRFVLSWLNCWNDHRFL